MIRVQIIQPDYQLLLLAGRKFRQAKLEIRPIFVATVLGLEQYDDQWREVRDTSFANANSVRTRHLYSLIALIDP
ncbi:hypothetical protein EEDFHM_02275 [Methylorubrum populi]